MEQPRLLILDEPNSALNERETNRLFAVLDRLCRSGITMLYVSHRLEEVFAIAHCVTVTRGGRAVLTKDRDGLTIPEVIEAMIGTPPDALFPPSPPRRQESKAGKLVVRDLSGGPLRGVAFTAQTG